MKKLDRLRAAVKGRTARDASWIMTGQIVNLFFQAAYFILLARLLGVVAYGIFAGAFALVSVITPYSALGSAMLFTRYVSLDPKHARPLWGNMLVTILVASAVLGGGLLLIAPSAIGHGRQLLVLMLIIANCIMAQIVNCASSVFFTLAWPKDAATNRFLANMFRTIMLLGMLVGMRSATATQWAVGYLVATTLAAVLALLWVQRAIGSPKYDLQQMRAHFSEGFGFSLAASTESFYNDLDKIMLSHYGMNVAVGIYTLAYRVSDFATAPVGSLRSVIVPRWFALHGESTDGVVRAFPRMLKASVAVALGAGLFIFAMAPLITRVIGHGFDEATHAIRYLCWLPVLRAVHLTAGDVLTTTGLQSVRTWAQVATGVLNAGLNVWLIPRFGWVGAAWASLASDAFLGILNLVLMFAMRWPKQTEAVIP